jgi:hypothetical protein
MMRARPGRPDREAAARSPGSFDGAFAGDVELPAGKPRHGGFTHVDGAAGRGGGEFGALDAGGQEGGNSNQAPALCQPMSVGEWACVGVAKPSHPPPLLSSRRRDGRRAFAPPGRGPGPSGSGPCRRYTRSWRPAAGRSSGISRPPPQVAEHRRHARDSHRRSDHETEGGVEREIPEADRDALRLRRARLRLAHCVRRHPVGGDSAIPNKSVSARTGRCAADCSARPPRQTAHCRSWRWAARNVECWRR